jgi:peptidoglycan/LPS O-acetylase OafA/YrhL
MAREIPAWAVTTLAIVTGQAFREAGLMHLWFLYYLLLLYTVLAAVVPVVRIPRAADRLFARLVGAWAGVAVLAAPAAIALAFAPERFGVPTPDRTLVPDWRTLTAYGSCFLAGWLLHRQPALLQVLEARRRVNLVSAAALGVVVTLAYLVMAERRYVASAATLAQWAYSAGYALMMWLSVLGLSGWFLARFSRPSAGWRFLSDSSYFLYLAHLPLVACLQVAVARLPWLWPVKFALILSLTVTGLLVVYAYLVRPTWIGALLNGRRRPHGVERLDVAEQG